MNAVVSSPATSMVKRFDMIASSEKGLPFPSLAVTMASTKLDGFCVRSGSTFKRVRASASNPSSHARTLTKARSSRLSDGVRM